MTDSKPYLSDDPPTYMGNFMKLYPCLENLTAKTHPYGRHIPLPTICYVPSRDANLIIPEAQFKLISRKDGKHDHSSLLFRRQPKICSSQCQAKIFRKCFCSIFLVSFLFTHFSRLLISVPSAPPSQVSAQLVSRKGDVIVTWTRLPTEVSNGIILGYYVHSAVSSAETTSQIESLSSSTLVSPYSNKAVLKGLKPYSMLELTVSAFTVAGEGPRSAPVFVGGFFICYYASRMFDVVCC